MRVNDDTTTNSQFLPKIALDPTTGKLAVVWYDARADLGAAGRATPTAWRTTTPSSGARSAPTAGDVHSEHPDQRRHLQLARLRQRHRLRRLHRPVVLRRDRAPGVVRQLQQHRQQPGRRAAPAGHLHRRGARAVAAGEAARICFPRPAAGRLPCPVTALVYGAVVALEMSLLPKFAGQSSSGQGAGNTR